MIATLSTMERRSRKARKPEPQQLPGMVLTPYQEELLEQSLYDSLGLPERTVNHLERLGILTLGQLLSSTREELLAIRNFGEKTLADVYARLEDLGFFRVDRRNQPPPEPEPADTRPPWMDFRRQD